MADRICWQCAPVLGRSKDDCERGDVDECAGCGGATTHFVEVDLNDISRRRLKRAAEERMAGALESCASTDEGKGFLARVLGLLPNSEGHESG